MSDGWKDSAQAWIASVGERGDWGRLLDMAAFLGHGLQLVFFSEPGRYRATPRAPPSCAARLGTS